MYTLAALATLAVAGLFIAIGNAVCNELSAEEERKQQQMRDAYHQYRQKKQQEYISNSQYYKQKRTENYKNYEKEFENYQHKLIEKNKEQNKKLFENYLSAYEERLSLKSQLLKELQNYLISFEQNKDKQQNSYIRYHSLKQTLLLTTEGLFKTQAYILYLENWKEKFTNEFNESGEICEPFDFKLPEEYPYLGKVMDFRKEDFEKSNDGGYHIKLPVYPKPIWLNKTEIEFFEKTDDNALLPFMVTSSKQGTFYFSFIKGIIKKSIGGTAGFKAQVIENQPNRIRLGFEGHDFPILWLPKSELKRKNCRTPVGSTVQVFVKEYDFSLQHAVTVSEKAEIGFAIEQFDRILLVESKDEYTELKELYEYLQENKLLEEADEWRVAPIYKKNDLVGFKMQQGNNYAYRVYFDTSFGENRTILKYGGLIQDKSEFISFDDMFVTTNVSVVALSPNKIRINMDQFDSYFKECNKLLLYLSTEFTNQKRIMEKTPMSNYLKQWEEVTRRLSDVKSYGQMIQIKVEQCERHGKITYLTISNKENLIKLIDAQEKNTRYFITAISVDKKIYCSPCEEKNKLKVFEIIDDSILIKNDFSFYMYTEAPVYAEHKQLTALSSFRNGKIASDYVKTAIVNTHSSRFIDNGNRIEAFFNTSIQDNKTQQDAITRAFASKDFFIIQGPPGTGKTTVIKELICQQLALTPSARILIVSQANVAVDNVIRGIIRQGLVSASKVIRCGVDEKLADDILPFSFDTKIEDYKKKISDTTSLDSDTKQIREFWIKILKDKEENSIVGEYLLKQHQIIGATCVGLENRKYGLSDMEFDLVIIDEAGKALPGELLIPINHAKKLIIIGDHKQLPPVIDTTLYKGGAVEYDDVVTQEEKENFLGKSFFHRLYEDCPADLKCMLNIQFRMPIVIANMVNLFYDNKLQSGENCKNKTPLFLENNLIFVDMKSDCNYKEKKVGQSIINEEEILIAKTIVAKISKYYKKRIVIITPYLGQKHRIAKEVKKNGLKNVYVNTIDALQGDEEDVVIYCTTRAITPTKYFSDAARLNVAFSRTKNTLIFIGSSAYLKKYKKGHTMEKIGEYLLNNAKMTDYNEWLSDDFDLKYHEYAEPIKMTKRQSQRKQINNNKVFFEKIAIETEKNKKQTCVYCSTELAEWEKILCSRCINKSHIKTCKGCGKKIQTTFYEIYIQKIEARKCCEDCKIVNCCSCGTELTMQKSKCRELKASGKDILCSNCLKKKMEQGKELIAVGRCEACGKKIEYTRYFLSKNPNIETKYKELKSSGKDILCSNCLKEKMEKIEHDKELVSIGRCEACGRTIEYPRYILSKNSNLYNAKLHKECKDSVYKKIQCPKCGCTFSFSYGEKLSFERKGFDFPKKCKSCRGS